MKDLILLLPSLLIWLRLAIALLLLGDTLDGKLNRFFLVGVSLAFLSDLLDGMIARRLKIVTTKLRVLDSYIDIVFYICLITSIYLTYSTIISRFYFPAILVVLLQLINWSVSLIKFGRLTSYHSYLAKLRALALFIAIALLFLFSQTVFLWVSICLACISNIEGVIISLILPKWHYDVWTIGVAIKIRNEWLRTKLEEEVYAK